MALEVINDPQWETNTDGINFFGETPEIATGGDVVEKVEKDDIKPADEEEKNDSSKKDDKPEKKEEDFNFNFNQEKTDKIESEEVSEDSEASNAVESTTSLTTAGTLNFLKEKGLVEVSDEELTDLTEEDAEMLLEDKFNESIEKSVGEKIAGLPNVLKQLVRLAVNNGDVESALAELAQTRAIGLTTTMDVTKEENQETILRFKLSQEGYDEEDIDSQIEFMKDSGKLEKLATNFFNKWKQEEEEEQEEKVKETQQIVKQNRERQLNFKKEVASHLIANEEINNFVFTKKDQKELPDYVSVPSVKTVNGTNVTPFWNDLMQAMQDKDKMVVLAKIVKDDFKFDDLEKKLKTKTARELKTDLQRKKETKIPTRQGSSQTTKSLIDLIDN
jgi:hypothetical protein